MNLDHRVAIVTGGANGIGLATARRFGAAGVRVVIADFDLDALHNVTAELRSSGFDVTPSHTDVSDLRQLEAMVKLTIDSYGRLDILHNNAFWSIDRNAVDLAEDEWDRTMNVCLKAVWYASKIALPHMIRAGSGSIVNTSSVEGIVALPNHCAYATAKAGLNHLTRQMAVDYGPFGIRVNAVMPGAIDTRGWKTYGPSAKSIWSSTTPTRRLGTTDEIARVVLFLAGDDAAYVNGECIVADGAWSPAARLPIDWMTS